MLIPAPARPWLSPDTRQRTWSNHGAMMIRRGEALEALTGAHASWQRLGLGALAWAMAAGGAVLVGRGIAADGEGPAGTIGMGLLVVATVVGGMLATTGLALTRAIAEWWTLATRVAADGGQVDTTSGPDTQRAHGAAVAADRTAGAGALWRMPLLPRTLAALALAVLAVVLLVQAGLGAAEATTPYAAGDVRGPWLARIVVAAVSLLTALLVARGLRRIHRARMHRDESAAADVAVGAHTPALGTGAIVVGGRGPVTGPPPAWAGTAGAASSDGAPSAAPHAPAPSRPGDVPGPAGPAGATPTVRLGDGRRLAPGVTLIGRAPQPRPGEDVDATLAVADDRVSKTHLTATLDARGVVVVDRGSTNGTLVHRPDGAELALRPGEPQPLAEGDVVVLGSTTLTVGEVPEDLEHTVLRPAR